MLDSCQHIRISNIKLKNSAFWSLRILGGQGISITGISGIALEIVDGGHMDQINISDIVMEGIQTPVFIRLGSRRNVTGSMKNILISNVIANNCSLIPSTVSGVPGFNIENGIKVTSLRLNCPC